MRPRGQTPWMPDQDGRRRGRPSTASMRPRGQTPWMRGSRPLPAVVGPGLASMRPRGQTPWMQQLPVQPGRGTAASMRPRGQTPWMRRPPADVPDLILGASMRPRGQTPWMRFRGSIGRKRIAPRFNEATGADPVDAVVLVPLQVGPPHASMRPRGQTPWMPRQLHRRGRGSAVLQ